MSFIAGLSDDVTGCSAYLRVMNTATALRRSHHVEDFTAQGRLYRWREGEGAGVRPLRHALRREEIAELT